jgi:branched-subunit amino acid ABC-type transport system permease component
LWIIASIVASVFLHVFLKFTLVGKSMRAVSYDAATAQLMGINIDKIYALCFALGMGFVGLTGGLYSFAFTFSAASGGYLNMLAFILVVLGGLGNYIGTIAASFGYAFIAVLCEYLMGPLFKDLAGFTFMVIVLIIRSWRYT